MGRWKAFLRSTCKHVSPVVVNAVEGGGRRAHCLVCGALGPVHETSEAARRALAAQAKFGEGVREMPGTGPHRLPVDREGSAGTVLGPRE